MNWPSSSSDARTGPVFAEDAIALAAPYLKSVMEGLEFCPYARPFDQPARASRSSASARRSTSECVNARESW